MGTYFHIPIFKNTKNGVTGNILLIKFNGIQKRGAGGSNPELFLSAFSTMNKYTKQNA